MQVEKRYNYTTPKTFLELIKLYKSVLARKRNQVQEAIDRLDTVSSQRPMQGNVSCNLLSANCSLAKSYVWNSCNMYCWSASATALTACECTLG